MSELIQERPSEKKSIVHNPHFWAIVLIMAFLTVLYNAGSIAIESWFPQLKEVFGIEFYYYLRRRLFLIPVLYAGAVFRLPGAFLVWLAFLAATIPRDLLYLSPQPEYIIRRTIFATTALILGVLIALERNRRQREKEAFSELAIARRTHLGQILRAQERERQHMAQELHDDTLQSLLVVANRLQALRSGDSGHLAPEVKREVEKNRDMVLQVSKEVRKLAHTLRPSILDSMGLVLAIRWLAERLTSESNIATEVEIKGEERKLHSEAEGILFRIAQEALNNIRRHSGATAAKLLLHFAPGSFKIAVQDNGRGFRVPKKISDFVAEGKLGLNGICERAELLNATFNILSEPGKGTTLTVEARL